MTDARIDGTLTNVLASGTPEARLDATYAEVLYAGVSDMRLDAVYAMALVVNTTSATRLDASYLMVLADPNNITVNTGRWGIPVS